MHNVSGAGVNVPNPLAHGDAQPRVVKPSPEEVFQGWAAKFPNIPIDVFAALSELAHGRLADDDCIQEAFCRLLNEGEFESCFEIFEAHRTVREAAAGAPVTTALRLTLRVDWNPDLDKLEALFKQLRVDSLTVDAGASTFPAAGCHCIATLLKGGLSELRVGGRLAKPEVVAEAFRHSQLQSMVFLGSSASTDSTLAPIDVETLTTASVLVEGLVGRNLTLVSLAIHDERLLEMRYYWERLLSYRPSLQTLTISLKMPNFKKDAWNIVNPFMRLVRDSNAFSAIALTARPDISGLDARQVHSAILTPLKGHPRLSSLELLHMPTLTSTQQDLKTLRFATSFAASCECLAHFVWISDASHLSLNTLRAFVSEGGNLDMSAEIEHILADSKRLLPRMEKMALIGHPMATGPVNALTEARGVFDSRMDLDLRGCLIDMELAIKLAAAWKKGPSTGKLVLPANFDRYYLLIEGHIWGISENAARDGFVLDHEGGLDQATCNRAVAVFDALKPALLELMRGIRQQLVQSTSPLLESNVQAFMQAALRSALPNIQGVSNDAFSLPAKTIVEQLVKEERMPTLVRLAAVDADMHKNHQATLDELNVGYGRFDLRSDTAQLVHMEKDRHAELMAAVESCDMGAVDKLLGEGAIDIGGRAFQRAQQLVQEGRLLDFSLGVFQKHVPTLATDSKTTSNSSNTSNTSVTTINTTTTTTTTSTTGTLSASTTAAQVVAVDDAFDRTEATWKAWDSKIPHDAPDHVVVNLHSLAQGALPDPFKMQRALTYLLKTSAFDLFVDAFEAYNSMRRAAAQAMHEPPFRSSLVLSLLHDWAPDIAQMNLALQRIQVDTLTLTPADPLPTLKPAPFNPHLSAAACHLVATLLKGGTTDLRLGGVLDYPRLVAEAMPHSKLRSLALYGVPRWTHYLAAQIESYETLASGVVGCTTLEEVTIDDEKLFALCLSLLYASPKLNSLAVNLGNSMKRSEITRFMEVAGGLPALSRVRVHFGVTVPRRDKVKRVLEHVLEPVDASRVQTAIFNPLARNATLTTLDMGRMTMTAGSPINMSAAPKAFVFAASCPSLKHFSWTAIPTEPLTVKRLQALKDAGGDLDMVEASAHIAKAYAKPDSVLTTLSLTGFVLPAGPMQAWSAALAGNRSLRRLDLRGCLMDATSAATLFLTLQKNPLFETIRVSTNYSDYYFRFEGMIWSITRKSDGSGFELFREGEPDEALDRRVAVAFKAVEDGLRKLIEMSLGDATLDVAEAE